MRLVMQMPTDPGKELGRREGLGYHVDGPSVEGLDAGRDIGGR